MSDRFDNIWDAIEDSPAEAVNMRARAEIMMAIRSMVESWGITQARSAKRLGVTQPRMNDLLRGRIDKFSLDTLMQLATRAGLTIEWHVVRPAA
ncbi:MAG: XRE family transcriptional regulator [Rhizobiales bacterium]|nr:XRE family transcriptional regulator [Hyphomicrobiales bacterium]MBI3672909.1 XRE family transcriptional regulator [Hyphomicrobiales bacterium]